jgi:hypothetical protein
MLEITNIQEQNAKAKVWQRVKIEWPIAER